jgi:hypothetical protein
MELLLNLAWLLLALPAYWLWQRSFDARAQGRLGSLKCLLSLACLLVLLFPVISATDDLHAMRAEMEESSPGKRGVRQAAAADKASVWHSRWQTLPAVVAASASLGLIGTARQILLPVSRLLPVAPPILRASRAPPCPLLA